MPFQVEIIADSVNEYGNRLTTFFLRYPRFIHAELMTHRVLSRNASSSRAIPSKKLRMEAWDASLRAGPIFWGKNQKGMQAAEELEGLSLEIAKWTWGFAARSACIMSKSMEKLGMHKQIVNRVIEPFTHISVVVTATEFMNFFGLRLDKDAQPEIQALAHLMFLRYIRSKPSLLKEGEWHTPYANDIDTMADTALFLFPDKNITDQNKLVEALIKISVARCARTSYQSFETGKKSTVVEDLKLYDRLLSRQPIHASPAEHQATPDVQTKIYCGNEWLGETKWKHPEQHGNFVGFRQHRKMLAGENMAPLPEGYRL